MIERRWVRFLLFLMMTVLSSPHHHALSAQSNSNSVCFLPQKKIEKRQSRHIIVVAQQQPSWGNHNPTWRTPSRPRSSQQFPYTREGHRNDERGQQGDEELPDQRTLAEFATRGSRVGFIRKVYAIFAAQMLCTIAVTAVVMSSPEIQVFMLNNFVPLFVGSNVVSVGVVTLLVSNTELRYRHPSNLILLAIITIIQSFSVGIFSAAMNPRTLCLGTIHTLCAVLAITLYSFQPQPKYDLTPLGNILLTLLVSLFSGSLLTLFFNMPLMDNIISAGMAILFATYVAYHTQMIVGGKNRKFQYNPKEYILAALNLYQDVISLFIQIMKILSKNDKNNRSRTY